MTRDTLERLADAFVLKSGLIETYALDKLRAGETDSAIRSMGIAEGYRQCAARLRAAKEAKE